ncbi:MAG: hypothetical protein PF961_23275 [Planctomycetota bacterium]|jgi:hypothetical protein|nr:hypothetical protein [Planctomycetota bacterium]
MDDDSDLQTGIGGDSDGKADLDDELPQSRWLLLAMAILGPVGLWLSVAQLWTGQAFWQSRSGARTFQLEHDPVRFAITMFVWCLLSAGFIYHFYSLGLRMAVTLFAAQHAEQRGRAIVYTSLVCTLYLLGCLWCLLTWVYPAGGEV